MGIAIETGAGRPGEGPYLLWHVVIDPTGVVSEVTCQTHDCLWASLIGGLLRDRLHGRSLAVISPLIAERWQDALHDLPLGRRFLIDLANQSLRAVAAAWNAQQSAHPMIQDPSHA